jgi:hypothetical protein
MKIKNSFKPRMSHIKTLTSRDLGCFRASIDVLARGGDEMIVQAVCAVLIVLLPSS